MDLKLKDKEVLIEGVALPMPYQISLKKRGKTVVNHRYVEGVRELQIYCYSCHKWHSVYNLENGEWININETYKLCNKGKHAEYFDTYCLKCYAIRNKIDTKTVGKEQVFMAENDKESNVKKERIQQTVFLNPENDMYIKLYCVFHNKKKNQLINEIIAQFKDKNPINL